MRRRKIYEDTSNWFSRKKQRQAEAMQKLIPLTQEDIAKAFISLKYFFNNVYPLGFTDEQFKRGDHLDEWAEMRQNTHSCIIASRKHGKSMSMYAYIMWEVFRNPDKDLEILYVSYKDKLAKYHIGRLKQKIRNNPVFSQLMNITREDVEGIARYTWDGQHKITISSGGILSFERGKHPDILILDDVLADPADALNFGIIEKINRLVLEVAFSLPKEGGKIHVIGTPQTPVDFFFKLKDAPHFKFGIYPAIKDWKQKKVLWPEMFTWERLMQIREHETGHKGFEKEYMCKPVWSADSFFKREDIMLTINPKLKNYNNLRTKNDVGVGWDIGKHSHPAYVTVFEFIPIGKGLDLAVQRHIKWMDGWEYKRQLDYVKGLAERMRADWVNFDNTRGELEGFYEKGYMDKSIFHPINFSLKMKNKLATEYEKRVLYETEKGERSPLIQHINDQRSINQILTVTNDLQAVATPEGHGDSFWGNALALYKQSGGKIFMLEDEDNILGFM